jgi:hypothetical protein
VLFGVQAEPFVARKQHSSAYTCITFCFNMLDSACSSLCMLPCCRLHAALRMAWEVDAVAAAPAVSAVLLREQDCVD